MEKRRRFTIAGITVSRGCPPGREADKVAEEATKPKFLHPPACGVNISFFIAKKVFIGSASSTKIRIQIVKHKKCVRNVKISFNFRVINWQRERNICWFSLPGINCGKKGKATMRICSCQIAGTKCVSS